MLRLRVTSREDAPLQLPIAVKNQNRKAVELIVARLSYYRVDDHHIGCFQPSGHDFTEGLAFVCLRGGEYLNARIAGEHA